MSRRRARGRHGRRGAFSGVLVAVLRVGIGSRGGVDHAGVIRLTGASPPARLAGQSWQRRRVSWVVSLTCGDRLSVREREREQRDLLFSKF